MSTWRQQAGTAVSGEVVTGVQIWSASERRQSNSGYYTIKAGVARGDRVDWIATWAQSARTLEAQTVTDIIDDREVDRVLADGDQLVFEVTKSGSPASIVGISAQFLVTKRGDGQTQTIVQATGQDEASRQITEAIGRQINSLGFNKRFVRSDFSDPVTSEDVEVPERKTDSTHTGSIITHATSGTPGSLTTSLTITPGSGKTAVGVVKVGVSFESNAAGNSHLEVYVYDGSATHHGQLDGSTGLGHFAYSETAYPFSITSATTFTIYGRSYVNTAKIHRRLILADWTEQ